MLAQARHGGFATDGFLQLVLGGGEFELLLGAQGFLEQGVGCLCAGRGGATAGQQEGEGNIARFGESCSFDVWNAHSLRLDFVPIER
jgi:hypothetical protein